MLKEQQAISQLQIQQLEAENQRLKSELIHLKYKELIADNVQNTPKTHTKFGRHEILIGQLTARDMDVDKNKGKKLFDNFELPAFLFQMTNKGLIFKKANKATSIFTDINFDRFADIEVSDLWHKRPEIPYMLENCYQGNNIKCYEGEYAFSSKIKRHIRAVLGYVNHQHLCVVVEDLTHQKKQEQLINETLEHFKIFINETTDIFCMKDANNAWQLANKEIIKIFNLDAENYKGKTNIELAEGNNKFKDALTFCDETDRLAWMLKKTNHLVEFIPGHNGKTLYFDIYKIPTYYPDGTKKMLIVQGRNITNRVNNEIELKKSRSDARKNELKLRKILNALPDALFTLSKEGIITDYQYNDSFAVGKPPEEFLFNNVENLFSEEISASIKSRITRALSCENVPPHEYTFEISGIVHSFESRISKLDNEHVIALLRDITEQKKQKEELIKAIDKAEESDRLKSAFISNLSHEVRTPMNGIVGFAEMLADSNLDNGKRRKFSKIIIDNSRQLLNLLNDVLEISIYESGEKTPNLQVFSLNNLIREAYEKYSDDIQNKNIALEYTAALSDYNSYIESDRHRIFQLLSIFLSNAIKFTVKGKIAFGYVIARQQINFYIQDTGVGITPADQEHIFERFYQVESAKMNSCSGTGLGLSLARRIIKVLNGHIEVESEFGRGSIFYFYIPYKKAQSSGLL